ncbi:MAG: 4Fe-4S ferredoxin [Deltaproteobacteria bacterium]|nr:4Fe-4S ferredoxin [Deltaproteobacteria bacterium]
MGHLSQVKTEYRALVRRLEGGQVALPEPRDPHAWQGWREILEIVYTPEEAALAAKLPVMPTDLGHLATRLGIAANELKPRLDAMCDKGLVLDLVHPDTGKTKYLLSPPVVGFIEFSMMRVNDGIPKKRMAEALEAYTHSDGTFAREVFGGDTVIGRALVHESALGDEPMPDVLDWERATAILSEAQTWAVAHCYCRHKAAHLGKACDAPQEVCLSLGGAANFVIQRKFGRGIEKSEAMDLMIAAREHGLVQIADNVRNRPSYICNCCGCCCGQLEAINRFDLPAVNPSGFVAHSDLEKCSGCSRCSRACPITAITMVAQRVEATRKNDLHPVVNADRCIGCGVCGDACKKHAMTMARRPKRRYVPANAIERSLRMAIERGHLAQLLFDAGGSRGSRFLNQVFRTLTRLPGVQRALASEQVKSRFLRAALARVSSTAES